MEISKGKRYLILVILSLIAGMVYLTPFLRFTFYDQMLIALSIDDAQLGVIGATYGLFNVIGYIPSGFFANKFRTKTMLLVSIAGMALCTVWYALFPPFEQLVVIHAFYGIFSVGTFWSSYLKSVRGLGTDEESGRMFGMSEGFRGLGNFVISFGCLGLMGAFAEGVMGFRALLWLNVAVFALLAVLVIFFIPKDLGETGEAHESTGAIIKGMFKLLANPGTWICILLIACGYTLWNTCNGFLGTYCTRILNLDPNISSSLAIVRSYLIVFIAGVTGGIVMDKFKTKGQGFIFAYAFNAIVAALVFVTSGFQIICVVVTLVVAYAVNVLKSTYWSILGDAGFTLEQTGTATAIISLIGLTPDIFTPAIIGQIIDTYEKAGNVEMGFNIMLAWMVAWSLLGIVAGFLLKKRKQKLDRLAAADGIVATSDSVPHARASAAQTATEDANAASETIAPVE